MSYFSLLESSKTTIKTVTATAGLLAVTFALPALAQAPIVQPGAPGLPSRLMTVEEASDLASIQITQADIMFMQGMISHHAQALEMTALVEGRSSRDAMRLMSLRIALSQEDEIDMMQSWLRDRDLEAPSIDAHHAEGYDLMPGMLEPEELEALRNAQGAAFDNLFLELMIKHHNGAMEMVDNLLRQPGSAQDSALYAFTTDVTADQSSEVERMTAMLSGFSPDPRVNLKAGYSDAGQAALNMQLLASMPKPDGFFDPENPAGLPMSRIKEQEVLDATEAAEAEEEEESDEVAENRDDTAEVAGAAEEDDDDSGEPRPSLLNFANSDITFAGDILVAGNFHGFNSYNIADPTAPELLSSVVCPGGQGDVSILGNLLIMSVEQTRGRLDCGLQGVAEPESNERFRGIRIFDVSDFSMPRQVGAVQTCRGSHTHTVVSDPDDEGNIYVYGSGTSSVRPGEELDGCSDDSPFKDPDSALFRIDVIQIPVARPQDSRIVNRPFIFSDPESGVLAGLWEGGDHGDGTQRTAQTNQCHDITAYPDIGLAAGACSGNGILLDISDPINPTRLDEVIDTGFAYWHSATFNNDGTKVLFTDEWGGGTRPRCRVADPKEWGADAIYDIVDGKLQFRSHYKLPAPQTDSENCVAHNGSLVPVPGRDIFVQAWYQGGISVIDFTDSSNPIEIAYFDRGPLHEEELILAGYWSAYWFDGLIYGTEIARGLDVFQLVPSDFLSENEIAAASLRTAGTTVNPQQQKQHVWPADPVVALAYVDQLQRSNAISDNQIATLTTALDRTSELLNRGAAGDERTAGALRTLANSFTAEAEGNTGVTRQRYAALAQTLSDLATRVQ